MHATWEQLRPGVGVIRVGKGHKKLGDPYQFQLVGNQKNEGEPVELIGLAMRGFKREHHDAIGLCLLSEGFVNWSKKRYKRGILIPPTPTMIHLSSTFIKELIMSIDVAQAHAVKACENAVKNATHGGHTAFATAIAALGAAGEAGISAGKSDDLKAQGAAVANIFNALADVAAEGLKIPKTEAIHHDVVNLFNAMENVSNAIAASNRARLNAALSK